MRRGAVGRAVAGAVHHHVLAARRTGLRRRALLGLRGLLVSHGDPAVEFELAGVPLLLPLSHDLPLLRALFPDYSGNLARLTGAVARKYPDLAVVDIGANVGDSVALIRSAAPVPVLCVEGDGRFLDFLRTNTTSLRRVSIAPVFLAASTGEVVASLQTARGSGHLQFEQPPGKDRGRIQTVALDELLAEHPLEGRLKLIKSDTDGFEAQILAGAVSTLARHRPVLFFEYDPDLLARNGTPGLELLVALEGAGYTNALLYDNTGDLLLACRLDEHRHLEEVDGYFRGRGSERYLDVAAFHDDDADLFDSFRQEELERFSCLRGRCAP